MSPDDRHQSTLETRKADAYAPFFSKLSLPRFDSPHEERLHRKQRLAVALHAFAQRGFCEGVAGHVTVRDPIDTETFWVNPFGRHFGQILPDDLVRVDSAGSVVEGAGDVNVSAFMIHSHIHRARPDVVAAAHAHTVYGMAWSALGRPLDPVTQDACAFFEDHVVYDDARVMVTERSEAKDIANCLGGAKAAILRNHGLLTVGQTVDEAAWWFIQMDRCCQTQLLAETVGTPLRVDTTNARAARAVNGSSIVGWFQFQPIADEVLRTNPDLLR